MPVTIPIEDYEVVYPNNNLIVGTRENTSVPVPGDEETKDEGGRDTMPKSITGKLQVVRHQSAVTTKAEIAADNTETRESTFVANDIIGDDEDDADDAVRREEDDGGGSEDDDGGGNDGDDDEGFEEEDERQGRRS